MGIGNKLQKLIEEKTPMLMSWLGEQTFLPALYIVLSRGIILKWI